MNKKRILLARFYHESNSFSHHPTTMEDYKKNSLTYGDELMQCFRGTKSELGAYIETFEEAGDIEIIPAIDGDASPGGPVTHDTFEYFKNYIIDTFVAEEKKGHIDGIALVLHGAMITDDTDDGEGTFLKALRQVTGKELPITATLDMHANLTADMVENAILFPCRYYPHTDYFDRGKEAAQMLLDMIHGKAHPTTAFRKLRLIYPHIPTDESHISRMIPELIAESSKDNVHYVYFVAGFSRADIPIQGSAIYAITENDIDLAGELCDKYYKEVMDHLEAYELNLTPAEEAVRRAMHTEGISVIADAADNPGSGLMQDATEIIHELIRQGADRVVISSIWDPETVEQAFQAGPGATIHVRLGGKSSDKVGAPVETDAYIKSLSDGAYTVKGPMLHGVRRYMGKTAVLVFGGITCIVTANRDQTFDEEPLRANGIEPLDYSIIVLKSSVHYRAAWKHTAAEMLTVDMPNLTSYDECKVPYTRIPRPIFPLDSAEVVRKYEAAGQP